MEGKHGIVGLSFYPFSDITSFERGRDLISPLRKTVNGRSWLIELVAFALD
jgi:hypothetical protein